MIDISKTIFSTIKDTIEKLRFLGRNDSKVFKKVLRLIIINDLIQESNYREMPYSQGIIKKLSDLAISCILNNPEFVINDVDKYSYSDDGTLVINKTMQPYVNDSTEQTIDTWRRVWDSGDVRIVKDNVKVAPQSSDCKCKPFTPDPSCTPSIIIFPSATVPAHAEGKYPDIDIDSLTICEKMNIYFNKDEKQLYFLDPKSCTWEKMYEQNELQITLPTDVEHTLKNNTTEEGDEVLQVYLKDTDGNQIGAGSDVIVKNENYLDQVLP